MCPYCEKTFKTNVNCKKHMKTHIGSLTAQNPIGKTVSTCQLLSWFICFYLLCKRFLHLAFNCVYFLLRKIPTRCNYRESCQPP